MPQLTLVRTKVFIEEQGIPAELEWETADKTCIHAVATCQGQLAGVGRLLEDGTIGRLAVLPKWRRQGIAGAILQKLIDMAKQQDKQIQLHAQIEVRDFYRKFGFTEVGPIFYEAGIAHQTMIYDKDLL